MTTTPPPVQTITIRVGRKPLPVEVVVTASNTDALALGVVAKFRHLGDAQQFALDLSSRIRRYGPVEIRRPH